MWILPKNLSLPASSGSTATVEMLSDLNEQSQACSQSLSVRGTPSSLRIWSQKWRRDSWTQYLSGRMLRTSPANLSAISNWISSQLPIPAKGSATPGSDSVKTTPAISGPIAESLFSECGPDGSGLKTSKDTLRLDSPQSSPTWKKMVTARRGEYSARLKSARLTSGSGCSSWPTARTMDCQGAPYKTEYRNGTFRSQHSNDPTSPWYGAGLREAVSIMVPEKATRDGNWTTPCSGDVNASNRWAQGGRPLTWQVKPSGPPAPVNDNTPGSRRESWMTPRAADQSHGALTTGRTPDMATNLCSQIRHEEKGTSKLNPRWVETLMGLPMGWTSPDAPASLIRNWQRFVSGWLRAQTELMNCECAATELSPKPPSELSEFYIENLLDFELESLGLL